MNQKNATSAVACPPGTLTGGPTRTRFFDGMFLTQADLETEQRYWRIKRRLTNRALGQGVVWGLRLAWNPNKHAFALSPGYALDCCGNDLVVECPVEVSEQQLWSRADPSLRGTAVVKPAATATRDEAGAVAQLETTHACVVLQYAECAEEARPVHRDACAGPTSYCEPSRIRESARLLLVPPPTRPPPTPPEQFLDELYQWRDSLDPEVRDALFPDPGSPPATPATGLAPVSVRVTIPGATPATTTVQLPASGSSSPAALHAQQTVAPARPTAIATFELLPSAGWSFTAGQVTDQGRVVETVTPPAAPSMYWALDIALPEGTSPASTEFDFHIDDLEVGQTFGGSERGRIRAHVTGVASATATGSMVDVRIDRLVVTTELAEVFDDVDGQGCLRELPWGWTVDPANGSKIARTLVVASLYAYLSEVVRRSSAPVVRTIASALYALGWYALFGVNPLADVEEVHRRKLAQLILSLYQRWCDGFAYPGPRCSDEHHGVYLGCVEISRNGAIQSFDMWRHRRYVVTGPVLGHWAQQLGIAPIDVIAGRFASAMCCLAGLPPLVSPPFRGQLGPGLGSNKGWFHVGTFGSVMEFGRMRGAPVTWKTPTALAPRMFEALTAGDLHARPVEILAARLPDGGSVAIAVPRLELVAPSPRIRGDVAVLLRHGELRIREAGRDAVADFAVEVLRATPPTALLGEHGSPATRELAELIGKKGADAADLVEDGTDATEVRAGGAGDSEQREAAADLVELAEKSLAGIVKVAVKTLGVRADRASFASAETQEKLAKGIAGPIIPTLNPAVVAGAARRVAER